MPKRYAIALLALASPAASGAPDDTGFAFFERRIRPVLVEHCYECHAAGADKIGGKLLLDSRAGLLRGGESGPALVPGKPEESLLLRAVRREEEEFAMPPSERDPLPAAAVHDLVKWIRMGALDPREGESPHTINNNEPAPLWSLQPIANPQPPQIANTDWPRHPLDHFVLARLEAADLTPAGDAPPEVLARRLYFDLIGLAPSYDELQAFATDFEQNGRGAVETLVDRLLASPQFGERWARHWLDVARYGESNGNDGLGRNATFPHAWRYRDYVIAAFNADTPYDRFLAEQIAGDLLPASTAEQRNRNLVATGFLAIGFKPAAAMNQHFAMDVVEDQIDVVGTGVMGLSVACARCHDHKHDPIPTRDYYALAGIFSSTETLWGKAANEGLTAPPTPLHELRDSVAPEQKGGSPPEFAEKFGAAVDDLKPIARARLDKKPEAGIVVEKGVTFPDKNYAKLNEGRLRVEAPVPAEDYSVSFWFRNDTVNGSRPITAYLFSHAADGGSGNLGDHIGIGGSHDKSLAGKLYLWNGVEGRSLKGSKVVPEQSWHHVLVTRSGTQMRLYLNGELEIEGELPSKAPADRKLFFGARNDRFAPLDGELAELAVFDRPLTEDEVLGLHLASGQRRGTPQKRWTMGVRDHPRDKIADAKINIDGNSKKLGPVVPRGFLSACETQLRPPTIGGQSSGRLELADWLTRGDHPLTARVMVNRIWLHLFGRGIVATPDDFGHYGARPSHPKLLDHLATRFVRDGWSVKKLIRAIVLSRSYGLDSRGADPRLLAADPGNALLGRHARRRLDAETMRDRILQTGGTLELAQPLKSDIADLDILLNWPPGEAKYLHRPSSHRSVYLCMLRDAPPPDLLAFDLPEGRDVAGQRESSTRPTQALFLLNSPLVVGQAHALAGNLDPKASEETRVAAIYHRILGRDPGAEELARACDHVRAQEAELPGTDATDMAWASLCQALMASSEFRYVD